MDPRDIRPFRPSDSKPSTTAQNRSTGLFRGWKRSVGGDLVLVFVALVSLFVLTGLLTGRYRAESRTRAVHHFEQGQLLAGQGHPQKAVEQYRAALSIARSNEQYRLALALELQRSGSLAEAETHLVDILQSDPTNGTASLMMARLLRERNRTDDASIYYRRAIYGLWPDNPREHRIDSRFELADLLLGTGSNTQALGELLQLHDELPADNGMRKKLALMFLRSGSPDHAEEIYRQVLQEEGRDPEALAGLGESLFAVADYASARRYFRNALRYQPDDAAIERRIKLCDDVLALDPTLRGLSTRARVERTRRLLERSLEAMDSCIASQTTPPPPSVAQFQAAAKPLLSQRRGTRGDDHAIESAVSLSERLWESHQRLCGAGIPDDPLGLILARMPQ